MPHLPSAPMLLHPPPPLQLLQLPKFDVGLLPLIRLSLGGEHKTTTTLRLETVKRRHEKKNRTFLAADPHTEAVSEGLAELRCRSLSAWGCQPEGWEAHVLTELCELSAAVPWPLFFTCAGIVLCVHQLPTHLTERAGFNVHSSSASHSTDEQSSV